MLRVYFRMEHLFYVTADHFAVFQTSVDVVDVLTSLVAHRPYVVVFFQYVGIFGSQVP